jgi:hypothetical protein
MCRMFRLQNDSQIIRYCQSPCPFAKSKDQSRGNKYRLISKAHARALANYFHVSADLFV